MLVGDVASRRLAGSPGTAALKPLLFVAVGAFATAIAPVVFTIAATLLAPFPVMVVVQVPFELPLLPILKDQPAGGTVPVPMAPKFSRNVNVPGGGATTDTPIPAEVVVPPS